MMRSVRALPVAALAACAAFAPLPALAQEDLETTMPNHVVVPRAIPAELMGLQSLIEFKQKQRQGRSCYVTGCLIVVNETADYDAVGLFLDTGTPDRHDAPVWSPNLFAAKLGPHGVRWTFKTGDRSMCSIGARIVLRHRGTGEELSSLSEVSLCRNPRQDSALRIKVFEPRVTIEASAAD